MKNEGIESSSHDQFARAQTGASPINTEVVPKAARKQLSASYKLKIIDRIDAAKNRGEIGRILRSEGLYSSQVSKWRKARDAGAIKNLSRKNADDKAAMKASSLRLKALEKENARLEKKLKTAIR